VVEASARVLHRGIHDADQLVAGEVLVVRSADVGLTPLFLIASAIVAEQGGPLSHAAIIAREYGVPAVVNVRGATAAIHTGDRVRVDGNRGTVERIDGSPSIAPCATDGSPDIALRTPNCPTDPHDEGARTRPRRAED
jgi:rifampicin phosphotransferase